MTLNMTQSEAGQQMSKMRNRSAGQQAGRQAGQQAGQQAGRGQRLTNKTASYKLSEALRAAEIGMSPCVQLCTVSTKHAGIWSL